MLPDMSSGPALPKVESNKISLKTTDLHYNFLCKICSVFTFRCTVCHSGAQGISGCFRNIV